MITNTTFHVPFVMMISMKNYLQLYEIKDVQNTFLQYKRLVILCKHIDLQQWPVNKDHLPNRHSIKSKSCYNLCYNCFEYL